MDENRKELMEDTTGERAQETEEEVSETADRRDKEIERLGGRARLVEKFGKQTVDFTKPFEWCGKTYDRMDMNFEQLTGADMEAIDDELSAMGRQVPTPRVSRIYQRMLAARAADVPADMIEHLPLADYNAVLTAAMVFLTITG